MRAITFPKTADGEWTNRETKVRVAWNPDGFYRVWTAGLPDAPGVGVRKEYYRFADALAVAKNYVEKIAQPTIAAAYAEALAMNRVKDAGRLCDCDGEHAPNFGGHSVACRGREALDLFGEPTLDERHAEALSMNTGRPTWAPELVAEIPAAGLCLCATGTHVGHMRAISSECRETQDDDLIHHWGGTREPANCGTDVWTTPYTLGSPNWDEVTCRYCKVLRPAMASEDAGCTKSDGWLDSHTFEHNPAEVASAKAGNDGYDEYERCGKPSTDPVHGPTLADMHWTTEQEERAAGLPSAQAADFSQEPAVVSAGDEVEWLGTEDARGTVVDVEPTNVSIRWRNRTTGKTGSDHPTLGEFPGSWRVVRADGERVVEFKTRSDMSGLTNEMVDDQAAAYAMASEVIADARRPQVPADLDDDAAWAAYCAALPEPTMAELAATEAEFTEPWASLIGQSRERFRDNARMIWAMRSRGTLDDASHQTLRANMATYRQIIETYKLLAQQPTDA